MSDPEWYTLHVNPPEDATDRDLQSFDGVTASGDDDCTLPPVWANIVFDLETPEGERRMRECLDAPQWKAAVHEFERWLHDQIKYGDHAQAWIDAYEQVRMAFFSIFDDRGIDLWED